MAVLLRTFVVQTFFIPSGSMEPTLQIGDRILVNKLSYHLHGVDRGDIVVFSRPPAENCGGPEVNDLVKRVIGLPGETSSRCRAATSTSTASGSTSPGCPPRAGHHRRGPAGTAYNLAQPYRVPANDYFVMGDNRTDSCDSRYWGPIAKSLIVGKVELRVWPLTSLTSSEPHPPGPTGCNAPAARLQLGLFGLGVHPGHGGHRLALVEVHHPDAGGVATLRGDLAGRGADDHAAGGDQQDLLVERDHEGGHHRAPLAGQPDAAHALAAAGLAVEALELGPLAVAGVGDDQDVGVVRRHVARHDGVALAQADAAHAGGVAAHGAHVLPR